MNAEAQLMLVRRADVTEAEFHAALRTIVGHASNAGLTGEWVVLVPADAARRMGADRSSRP
jgi:microcompartment protein CcmK/EutM